MSLYIIYCRKRSSIYILLIRLDSETFQFLKIVGHRLRRVVGKEGITYPLFRHLCKKILCKRKQRAAQVYGTIHIKGDMLYLGKFRFQFRRNDSIMIGSHILPFCN